MRCLSFLNKIWGLSSGNSRFSNFDDMTLNFRGQYLETRSFFKKNNPDKRRAPYSCVYTLKSSAQYFPKRAEGLEFCYVNLPISKMKSQH